MPFTLTCTCGQSLAGFRSQVFQTIPCPRCAMPLIVFPASQLAALLIHPAPPPRATVAKTVSNESRRPRWQVIAAGLLLGASFALLGVALFWPSDPRSPQNSSVPAKSTTVQAFWDDAEQALKEGDLDLAADHLSEAQRLLTLDANSLDAAGRKAFLNRSRQVLILADLTTESLPELLHPLPDTSDRVWDRQFTRHYGGRSILIDGTIRRDGAGSYHMDLEFETTMGPIRLMWESVRLLNELPLETPTRLLIGVRMSRAKCNANRRWTIEFQPESGVLVTDADLLRFTSLPPDEELKLAQKRMMELSTNRVR